MRAWSLSFIVGFSLVVSLGTSGPAAAAQAAANPCAYQNIDPKVWGEQPYQPATPIHSVQGVLKATLKVAYSDPKQTSVAGCPVTLRTYNGQLVGPELWAKPGDKLEVTLVNAIDPLPGTRPDPKDCHPDGDQGEGGTMAPAPAVYNVTNLHTHGLHVSPKGNSDNVFIELCPGQTKNYEIDIPSDHPAGTFWYHAHVHGSTALQVSSGLEGALIIEGGVDAVPAIHNAQQKTLLLQQIAYDETGRIENYDNFGPGSWADSMRYITVNGQIAPKFTMHPGEVQRLRFVDGGIRETIDATVYGPNAKKVPLYEFATDGLVTGHLDAWKTLELEPGYRSDVLFKAPLTDPNETVVYTIRSEPILGANSLSFRRVKSAALLQSLQSKTVQSQVIAVIEVSGATNDMPLPTEAELQKYVPFKPIADSELTGEPQTVSFSIESNMDCSSTTTACSPCTTPGVGTCQQVAFMVDHYQYPNSPVRKLKLATASQWTLQIDPSSVAPEHPFHIHVNPFEMVRTDPNGNPETIWKDTLMIHQGNDITVRSRYEDYDGAFVLHCHILDHEDGGMMQEVEIVN